MLLVVQTRESQFFLQVIFLPLSFPGEIRTYHVLRDPVTSLKHLLLFLHLSRLWFIHAGQSVTAISLELMLKGQSSPTLA